MNAELIVLRILHVLPGVIWVGGASLMAWVIEPQIRAAGPQVQGPAMSSIAKKLTPVLVGSAALTILVGFALIMRTPGHEASDLFSTSWGWAIGLGMVLGIAAGGIGGTAGTELKKIEALGAQISGAPTPAQAAAMAGHQATLRRNSRIASILGLVAVALMVSARYL